MKKERLQRKFLHELRKIPIVQIACERCGISRQTAYRWRQEDPLFTDDWEDALEDGESLINDMAESQLLQLIKEKKFFAVRYWLSLRHPKFKKEKPVAETVEKYVPGTKGVNPSFYKEWIATLSDEEITKLLRDVREENE